MTEPNENPVVAVKLEAATWVQAVRAIRSSPDAGNYLAAEAATAIDQALKHAGVKT